MTDTILVVDDDDLVRDVAQAFLEDAGYQVVAAAWGGPALAQLDANPDIRLLITDVAMPGMSGFELADLATRRDPALKVIYMSGYREGLVGPTGVLHGPVLEKPYARMSLVEAVRAALA